MQSAVKFIVCILIFCNINTAFAKPKNTDNSNIPVTIKSLSNIAIYPENSVPADVISLKNSTISAEISGSITDINVLVGNNVEANATLLTIECADYESQLSKNLANLAAINADIELTKWQLTKSQRLAQQNNISEEKVRQLKASLSKLEANHNATEQSLVTARKNVARCNIVAPYSGLIISKYVNKGEFVTPGTKLVELINTDEVELDAKVHSTEVNQIKQANGHNLLIFKSSNQEYPVKIRTIVASKDPKTKAQTVRLVFSDKKPIPGSSGRLLWKSLYPQIPPEFVQHINDKFGIFVVSDDKALFYELPHAVEGRNVEIKHDFSYPIIVEGRYNVKDGQKIKIIN